MFYPEKFKDFVEMSKIFAEMVSSIENHECEFNSSISEDADKLKPYIIKSHPLLIEYYSTPARELFSDLREEINKEKQTEFSKEAFKENVSALMSDDYIDSILPSDYKITQEEIDECLPDIIASTHVCLKNFRALTRCRFTINHLIEHVSNGVDDSLFKAISIDPIVDKVPVISERIALAESLNDSDFLKRLAKARRRSREDNRIKNPNLDYFLILFHVTGILSQLTVEQRAHIFINEIGVYKKDDESLKKHIYRWRKNYNQSLRRIEILNSKKSRT